MDANGALLVLAIVLSILGAIWLAVIVHARKRLDIAQQIPEKIAELEDWFKEYYPDIH